MRLISMVPVLRILIAAGLTLNLDRTVARRFSTGFAHVITGPVASNDNTLVLVDQVHGELLYA